MADKRGGIIIKAGVLLFWLAVWQAASLCVGKALIVPSPLAVARTLYSLSGTADFWVAAGLSLLRIFVGFITGLALGCVLAVLTSVSRICSLLLSPVISVVRATPVVSFILLVLLWLPSSVVPAFISSLMVAPVVWGDVSKGIAETDRDLLEMARAFKMRRWRYVYIPSVKPYFTSACLTSLGLAWKSGVAAEALCLPRPSIGSGLYYARIYFESPELFAWTIVVIILSMILEKLFVKLIGRKT
ncbi:MAG: ABC transporter permease [Oscillospiraceae bacterium]|jgi:NitT/TauT family transport system permease protein